MQIGYSAKPAILDIEIIADDNGTFTTSSSLSLLTIILIVLGCIFFIIIVLLVIITFATRSLCFAGYQPQTREDREDKKRRKKVEKSNGSKEDSNTVVIDRSYVVGQDYKDNNQ